MQYRFGPFELSLRTRELRAHGEPRAVEPQVLDLIACLVEARDRVVSSDELVQQVWKRRVVSEAAISARIAAARAALDDDGKQQRWIRTLPRRGFRFVGEVEAQTGQETSGVAPPRHVEATRQRIAFCRSRDGTRIAYATAGEGPPLVKAGHWLTHLEHDWNSPIWRPLLGGLGARYRLVRYDQRGNGLSDWELRGVALDDFVDDLEAVVDAAGLDRFPLYGTSQGVPIAVAFARRHPERVSRLVLHGGFEQGRLVRDAAERAQGEAILTLIRHGWGRPGSAFIEAFATMFIPDGNREQIDSLCDLQRQTTSPENAAALRRAVDLFDVADLLAGLDLPTLVIHARHDAVQPFEQGRRIAAKIPGAAFAMLESRNHVLLPQEPAWAALFDELDRFLLAPEA